MWRIDGQLRLAFVITFREVASHRREIGEGSDKNSQKVVDGLVVSEWARCRVKEDVGVLLKALHFQFLP